MVRIILLTFATSWVTKMSPERIKELLFEIGDALSKARNSKEWEALQAKFTALKTQWNKQTGNQILSEI